MYLTVRDRAYARESPTTRQRVASTVVLLGVVSLFTDISTESVNAVLPKYLIFVVGLSPQAFGFVTGLYTGISVFVRMFGAWLSDRADRPKWVAFTGYFISALSRVGLLFAGGLTAISLIVTGDRLGKGLRTAPRDAMIASVTPAAAYGRAYGTHRALDTLGAALGPLIAFWILTVVADGFHAVFVVSLAAAAIGLAILLLLVPDVRPSAANRAVSRAAGRGVSGAGRERRRVPVRSLFANRDLVRIVVACGVLGLVTVGDAFLYLQLQLRDSLANNYYALLMVGMNAAYLVLAIPFGRLADRVGRTRVFLGGHVALVLCYLLAAGPLTGPLASVGCLVMLGSYYAATDGILAALAGQVSDPQVRTSGIALAQTMQALAAFVSSLAVGLLWSQVGLAAALRWYVPLLVLAIPVAAITLRGPRRAVPA